MYKKQAVLPIKGKQPVAIANHSFPNMGGIDVSLYTHWLRLLAIAWECATRNFLCFDLILPYPTTYFKYSNIYLFPCLSLIGHDIIYQYRSRCLLNQRCTVCMVFSSLTFLYLFLPACLLLYFVLPSRSAKNWFLTAASLFFYAWGEPVWVCLLLVSALLGYLCGLVINKYRGKPAAKAALALSLTGCLGLLFTFKYVDFLLGSAGLLLTRSVPVAGLVMPIGISFFTFQTMSYVIDLYRGNTQVQRSFLHLLLFVSLFPQLIAGPILRYKDIAEQITDRHETIKDVAEGLFRFSVGLGKKVLIANYIGKTADSLLKGDLSALTVGEAWLGIMCFAFQIYFDFSGYSDMAIGLGRVFGFRYPENFRYPYISLSATEFWRRWHISLGSFFRDYVYISLGGNRKFQARNIMVTWMLTGLWHGASWNFILWGLYYGLLLVLEKTVLAPVLSRFKPLAGLYTAAAVLTGWALFYFTDFTDAVMVLGVMWGFAASALWTDSAWILLVNNLPLLLLAAFASTPLAAGATGKIRSLAEDSTLWRSVYGLSMTVFGVFLLLLSTVSLTTAGYNPFLYFRF